MFDDDENNVSIKGILRLGPKAIVMFLTGTLGIVAGGPSRRSWNCRTSV